MTDLRTSRRPAPRIRRSRPPTKPIARTPLSRPGARPLLDVRWQIGSSHGTASRFTKSPGYAGPPDGTCRPALGDWPQPGARQHPVGGSPQDMTGEQFRELARQAIADFGTAKPRGAAWQAFQRRLSFASADPSPCPLPGRGHRGRGAAGRRLPGAAVPPRDPAGGLCADGDHARRRGPGPRFSRHHREAIRHRPGLRPRAEPGRACRIRRVPGVPDRSLGHRAARHKGGRPPCS